MPHACSCAIYTGEFATLASFASCLCSRTVARRPPTSCPRPPQLLAALDGKARDAPRAAPRRAERHQPHTAATAALIASSPSAQRGRTRLQDQWRLDFDYTIRANRRYCIPPEPLPDPFTHHLLATPGGKDKIRSGRNHILQRKRSAPWPISSTANPQTRHRRWRSRSTRTPNR